MPAGDSGKADDAFCGLGAMRLQDRTWMWARGHNGEIKRAAHGYAETREAAMGRSPRVGVANSYWRRGRNSESYGAGNANCFRRAATAPRCASHFVIPPH